MMKFEIDYVLHGKFVSKVVTAAAFEPAIAKIKKMGAIAISVTRVATLRGRKTYEKGFAYQWKGVK